MKSFDIKIEKPDGCVEIYVNGDLYFLELKKCSGTGEDLQKEIKIEPNDANLINIPSAGKLQDFVLISGDFNKLYAAVAYYLSNKNLLNGEYVLRLMWGES